MVLSLYEWFAQGPAQQPSLRRLRLSVFEVEHSSQSGTMRHSSMVGSLSTVPYTIHMYSVLCCFIISQIWTQWRTRAGLQALWPLAAGFNTCLLSATCKSQSFMYSVIQIRCWMEVECIGLSVARPVACALPSCTFWKEFFPKGQ